MVKGELEKGEVRKIDDDTVEFRVKDIYVDSWVHSYNIYEVMSGLQLVPVAVEEKRLDTNITEVLRTYRLKTGYYALVEVVKYYTIKDAIAVPGATGPGIIAITYSLNKVKYIIYPLIVRNGMVFTVDNLVVEGETTQTDEVYKTVEKLINEWKNELPKYEAKFA
jgi:hypothetical protein